MAQIIALSRGVSFAAAIALAICLAASPAEAGKKGKDRPGDDDKGGLYHPVEAVTRPPLVLDTSLPAAVNPTATSEKPIHSPIRAAAVPAVATPPVRPLVQVIGIANMRVHALFE